MLARGSGWGLKAPSPACASSVHEAPQPPEGPCNTVAGAEIGWAALYGPVVLCGECGAWWEVIVGGGGTGVLADQVEPMPPARYATAAAPSLVPPQTWSSGPWEVVTRPCGGCRA
ncbi:hypothetical protein M427DRAFT_233963 [Gonapodya prolifera JEL478]|uniref:Uncharacterized protein n=1 Tax=Gonapodya prolifera (strain JEL478) TaxID=1344416 RepID=A0A139AMW0_GONPJ|nr:hypothetical protein M427DRAFT_233963 [Gonapodya prolifera JEL478]|eukprot:KXS17853.1 hypothetical protein M427DRAFT_233963 [Gonapodya prolifera JEL478]